MKKYRKNVNSFPAEKVRGKKVGEGRRLPQAAATEIKTSIENEVEVEEFQEVTVLKIVEKAKKNTE